MNLASFLYKRPGIVLWFCIVVYMIIGFNFSILEDTIEAIGASVFDLLVPFTSGCGMAYQYATWYYNRDDK